MPGVDWIPGVSQVKSLCQLVTGDTEGAERTQENFAKECPVVSQVTSVVQVIAGDTEGAKETQMRCLGTINNAANGIPIVGHIKGGVHHICGDHEGGNKALQAATRSSVVIGTGVAVGLASGGIAAIPAGIAAGSAYDLADTAISEKPKGFVAALETAVNNPNAGNIIDAAAVIVGDGLAGYSGGQIGKQINTQVKINNMVTARNAKMDQLNAGMFAEEGAANSMTTGQVTKLGTEINSLTAKIDAMSPKPQYLYDLKANKVVVQQATSGVKPVIVNTSTEDGGSNRQENKTSNVKPVIVNTSTEDVERNIQENGLEADCYVGEIENSLSPAEINKKKSSYVQQKSGKTTLEKVYPNTTTITHKDCEELNEFQDQDHDPTKNSTKNKLLSRSVWMHVQMPQEFGYTGAILANNIINGLLHTFVRHSNQWLQYIPSLSGLIDKLPTHIRQLIRNVEHANRSTVDKAVEKLNEELQNLQNKTDIDSVLLEIQLKLFEFSRKNVTSAQYLEEGVNSSGQIQVYFKVTNSRGETNVMVVCVSRQLFPSIRDLGDPRPVRTITTVFFKTWKEYKNSKIRAGKAWPKK